MKMPSLKMPKTPEFVKNSAKYVTDKSKTAYNYATQKAGEGLKYMKTLKNDTVTFVKKNPKQTAAAAGIGAAVVLIGAGIKHLVEKKNEQKLQLNMIKTLATAQNDAEKSILRDLINKQASVIGSLQERILVDKEVIDASKDIIDAFKSTKKS